MFSQSLKFEWESAPIFSRLGPVFVLFQKYFEQVCSKAFKQTCLKKIQIEQKPALNLEKIGALSHSNFKDLLNIIDMSTSFYQEHILRD